MFKVCHQLCYGFENLMSSWGFHFYCSRSFDQAGTLSLRGPAQFTDEARSAEFDGVDQRYRIFFPAKFVFAHFLEKFISSSEF